MNLSTMNKQIIFVDSSVQDYQSLIQGIDLAQIVILNENSSAIDQITNALADQKDIEAVHIVSHGSEGSLKLGADVLNDNNLETFSDRLKQWGNALTANGDILLYGCDVAAGEVGENFVKRLSEITGADVAASTNKTGNAALGGDWELEKTTGAIEASLALSSEAMATYAGVLAPAVQFNLTSVFDSDVISNYTGGFSDSTQNGLSTLNQTLITQSFATFKNAATGNGLPDNGFFAANAYHPDVQLGYNNTNNGNNAKVITTNGTSFNFAVTPNQYSEIHLFATSTNGDAGMQVTFNYSDGTTGPGTATVPDWFNEITETSSRYYLIDGMDIDLIGNYQDANDPAIFGFMFNPNPAKTLQSITVTKTSGTAANNYLGVFGATGFLETTPPTVSLTSAAAATVTAAFPVTATFSESTTNFLASDITVTNGTVSGFSGTGTTYTFTVTPTGQGTVTVNVPSSVATDAAGNNNTAATPLTRTFDSIAPTVALTSAAAATVTAAFPVTATFSESTTNFVASDITVTNGTVSGFSGTGTTYTFTVTPTGQGTVTVDVPSSVATDAAGNNNTAATPLTRTFDSIAPTVALTSAAAATVTAAFPVTATFSESTTNFVASDITVTNGTVSGFSGTGTTYTFTVTPTGSGTVTVNIPANIATDAAGNNNTAATALTRTADTTAPTAASFSPADNATSVAVTANLVVTLSEAVQKGTGNIVIKKVSDNSVVETIDVTSANVTVTGSTVTVNP
ncbi:DUF4347 domain-containing protein, partial [Microcoleus sp. S13_D1]|uniref:DUF4347 domain-containing protein n=3 Tax=Microcoleus TaxID=44471 RepID=UPI002FCECD39